MRLEDQTWISSGGPESNKIIIRSLIVTISFAAPRRHRWSLMYELQPKMAKELQENMDKPDVA